MTAETPSSHFDTSPEAQSARRKGRYGDRKKFAVKFWNDLYVLWEEQGPQALRRAVFHDPMGFVNMAARLMPQKIEITHPTDGLSDERLSELLDQAERMMRLKAAMPAHELADETRMIDVTPAKGGGGPERVGDAGGEGGQDTNRDAIQANSAETSNKLGDIEVQPATQSAEEAKLPYPVGRPQPMAEHVEKRANLAKLHEDEIDPSSLF